MSSDQIFRLSAKQFSSLTVHIGITPVFVKSYNRIADSLQDVVESLPCFVIVRVSGLFPGDHFGVLLLLGLDLIPSVSTGLEQCANSILQIGGA